MVRVGRNVDAFGVGVGQTQVFVGGQPVLNAENAQHGGRQKLAQHYFASQKARKRMRRRTSFVEHRVVILLGPFPILVPPLAQRWHVVTAKSVYRTIRESREIAKAHTGIFGHRLYFERQNA